MALNRLGQIALPVSSADRAEEFYGARLGLRKLYRYGSLVFFDCAGTRLLLEETGAPVAPSPGICHYFLVDDIEATRRELDGKGVAFVDEPHLIARMPDHELWMVFFRDPDGHLLALMEERRGLGGG